MALQCFHPGAPHLDHRDRLSAQFGRRGGRASLGLPNPRVASGRQESRLTALEPYSHLPTGSSRARRLNLDSRTHHQSCPSVAALPSPCFLKPTAPGSECPALSLDCPPRAISALLPEDPLSAAPLHCASHLACLPGSAWLPRPHLPPLPLREADSQLPCMLGSEHAVLTLLKTLSNSLLSPLAFFKWTVQVSTGIL